MLRKRSVSLSGHATSVALEPAFWAVLDAIAAEMDLGQAALMKRIDERRGRTPLASACRLLALAWAGGDRSFAEQGSSD
ncbi:ribbon-helix-helix domain-containing protein [Brevundimonas sp.]|uniref:ribbon-helix-helix domain-containing protein n=1 Tax=Brevundimonas sp. TaxID=1871086 RepID=UPI002D67E6E2|nr:ribbon-helix-helix domain-containing protein [Brevundimonas sp.]HYD27463.1 ribbon-helix-helix domain-containing protein [Brevundimonas sp.]